MLIKFNQIRRAIAEQRRKDLEKRLDLLRMARIFDSPEEKKARADLLKLRSQDWK